VPTSSAADAWRSSLHGFPLLARSGASPPLRQMVGVASAPQLSQRLFPTRPLANRRLGEIQQASKSVDTMSRFQLRSPSHIRVAAPTPARNTARSEGGGGRLFLEAIRRTACGRLGKDRHAPSRHFPESLGEDADICGTLSRIFR